VVTDPSVNDVVVRPRVGNSGVLYTLATHSGPDQFMFRSREEAVSRALSYAAHARVRAWSATVDGDFSLLGTFRIEQDRETQRAVPNQQ
jgi:LPS sulfotransferase NodH